MFYFLDYHVLLSFLKQDYEDDFEDEADEEMKEVKPILFI